MLDEYHFIADVLVNLAGLPVECQDIASANANCGGLEWEDGVFQSVLYRGEIVFFCIEEVHLVCELTIEATDDQDLIVVVLTDASTLSRIDKIWVIHGWKLNQLPFPCLRE